MENIYLSIAKALNLKPNQKFIIKNQHGEYFFTEKGLFVTTDLGTHGAIDSALIRIIHNPENICI